MPGIAPRPAVSWRSDGFYKLKITPLSAYPVTIYTGLSSVANSPSILSPPSSKKSLGIGPPQTRISVLVWILLHLTQHLALCWGDCIWPRWGFFVHTRSGAADAFEDGLLRWSEAVSDFANAVDRWPVTMNPGWSRVRPLSCEWFYGVLLFCFVFCDLLSYHVISGMYIVTCFIW